MSSLSVDEAHLNTQLTYDIKKTVCIAGRFLFVENHVVHALN
ncbi:hypothetical protein VCHA35P150_40085 [Vibrio chagasii]|nr:hypothetical protein VCHA35P150_40085 [Vibrio chagasii]CAH7073015.1 hypothetical protein VCHA49P381_10198 [Vibrio chagasii]